MEIQQDENISQMFYAAFKKRHSQWQQDPMLGQKRQILRYYAMRMLEEKDKELFDLWYQVAQEQEAEINDIVDARLAQDFNEATARASDDEYFSVFEKVIESRERGTGSHQVKLWAPKIIKIGRPYAAMLNDDEAISLWTNLDDAARDPHKFAKLDVAPHDLSIARNGMLETSLKLYDREYEAQRRGGIARLFAELVK